MTEPYFHVKRQKGDGPTVKSTPTYLRCICPEWEICKELTKQFTLIDDLRGGYIQLPNHPIPGQKMTLARSDRIRYIDRTIASFRLTKPVYSLDLRHRKLVKKKTEAAQPEQQEQTVDDGVVEDVKVKRQRKFIAIWHFHPYLVQRMHDAENKRLKQYWPTGFPAQCVNDFMGGSPIQNGWTEEDKKSENEYFALPKHNAVSARRDLLEAKQHYSELQIIRGIEPVIEAPPQDNPTSAEQPQRKKAKTEANILYDHLTGRYGGFNRLSVQSNRYFRLNPGACAELYGYERFLDIKHAISDGFDMKYIEPKVDLVKGSKTSRYLTEYERCLIGLMHIESGMSQEKIASIFGQKTTELVSQAVSMWAPQWGAKFGRGPLRDLSDLSPETTTEEV